LLYPDLIRADQRCNSVRICWTGFHSPVQPKADDLIADNRCAKETSIGVGMSRRRPSRAEERLLGLGDLLRGLQIRIWPSPPAALRAGGFLIGHFVIVQKLAIEALGLRKKVDDAKAVTKRR
jgi:hypothetical protein